MMRRGLFVLAVTTVVLTGCAAGAPDYGGPGQSAPGPTAGPVSSAGVESSAAFDPSASSVGPPGATSSHSTTVSRATVPADAAAAGLRPVTFHGITVRVPQSWKFHDTQCGIPVHDTWTLPGPEPACGLSPMPDVTSVQFNETVGADVTRPKGWTVTRITLPGSAPVAATLSRAPAGASPYSVWMSVPSRSASVLFTGHRRATVDALLNSVTTTDQDSIGCQASADDVNQLTIGKPPVRPGASEALIPVGVQSIRTCRYVAGYLEQSTSASGGAAEKLVAVLNSAPAGWSMAPTQSYSKDLCRDPDAAVGAADGLTSNDAEAYRIEADYERGPAVVVVVRLSLCGHLGEANGTRSGQETTAIAELLAGLVGNSQGWPGSVLPA